MTAEHRAVARREVKRVLTEKQWSNLKLATEAQVDPKTINTFLSDDGRWPQRSNRAKIAVALGWPSDELDYIEELGALSPAAMDEYEVDDSDVDPAWSPGSEVGRLMAFFGLLVEYIPTGQRVAAIRQAIEVLLPYTNGQVTRVEPVPTPGHRLSAVDDNVSDEIAAHHEGTSISGEQESPDTP